MDRDPILGRFDLGAFTLWPGGKLVVYHRAHGTEGFHEVLLRHHDSPVRPPQRPEWGPDRDFLDWHDREVFKGEARHRLEAEPEATSIPQLNDAATVRGRICHAANPLPRVRP
jgi:hypothetical protein